MALALYDARWNFAYDVDYNTVEINYTHLTPANYTSVRDAMKIVSGVTCALSIIGSLAIILSYIFIREIRSKARELLVHLSIMDLMYTTANFVGLILPYETHLLRHPSGPEYRNYKRLCEAQAFFAVYGTIGSILWTLGLAVYLYYRVVSHDYRITKRVVMVLYVVCYLLPLYPSLWLLVRGHLGYPKSARESGGWCTVLIGNDKKNESEDDQNLLLIMVDDIWIWLTFIIMLPIYLVVHCQIRAEVIESNNQRVLSPGDPRLVLLRTNQKFLLVPIAFIALRIWDFIVDIVFVHMRVDKNNHHHHYEALVYLDAIGDTSQGFVNFVFFCVLQAKVRQYIKAVICQCWGCRKHKAHSKNCNNDKADDESFTASVTPSQMSNYSSDPPRDWIEE